MSQTITDQKGGQLSLTDTAWSLEMVSDGQAKFIGDAASDTGVRRVFGGECTSDSMVLS